MEGQPRQDADPTPAEEDQPDGGRRGWISPRLSLFLIGGAALGGIACMCVGVLLLAVWRA